MGGSENGMDNEGGLTTDLLRGQRALQLLPAQQLRLDLVEGLLLPCRCKRLRALAVAPTEASGDEVGDAARLEEGVVLDARVRVEGLAELDHLLEADADDRRLGEGEG